MILVVNLNLAVDRHLRVKELRAGAVHRAEAATARAGGKGVNAARVLKTLGEPCVLAGFVGGAAGDFIAAGLADEGVDFRGAGVGGESRSCYVIGDESGEQTVVNEAGPAVSAHEWAGFAATFEGLLGSARVAVLTGSLPPGLPADAYAELVNAARARGVPAFLDCAGPALRRTLEAGPALVKVNHEEAAPLTGEAADDAGSLAQSARLLRSLGAGRAMVTAGASGAAFATEEGVHFYQPPAIEAVNGVGSGDAAMAGLAASFVRGADSAASGALAVAAGAANALHGFGRCTAAEIQSLLPLVTRDTLAAHEADR